MQSEKQDTIKLLAVLGCLAIGIGVLLLFGSYWREILTSKYVLLAAGLLLHFLALAPSSRKIFNALPCILAALGTALISSAFWMLCPDWLMTTQHKTGCIILFMLALCFVRDYHLLLAPLSFPVIFVFCMVENVFGHSYHSLFFQVGIFVVLGAYFLNAFVKKSVVSFIMAVLSIFLAQMIFDETLPLRPVQLALNALIFWGLACSTSIRKYRVAFSKAAFIFAFLGTSAILYLLSYCNYWEDKVFYNYNPLLYVDFVNFHLQAISFLLAILFYLLEFAFAGFFFFQFWKTGAEARKKIIYFLPAIISVVFLLCNLDLCVKFFGKNYEEICAGIFFVIWFTYLFFFLWTSLKDHLIILRIFSAVFLIFGGIFRIFRENFETATIALCFLYSGIIILLFAYFYFKISLSGKKEEKKIPEPVNTDELQ